MENLAINDFFENLLKISPDFITGGVVIICAALFVVSLFSKWRDVSPALMISAGIIGTFWGTFIALADFETGADHKAMVESIPAVLSGMKTAFVTSLIGLFGAFTAKIIFHALPKKKSERLPVETETIDLLEEIKDGIVGELGAVKSLKEIKDDIAGEKDNSLSSRLSALRIEYRDGITDLKQSIAGEGDSSIASQLIKLREENVDGLRKLDEHTIIFTEQLADLRSENIAGFNKLDERMDGLADIIRNSLVSSVQELIKELREVIADQLVGQLQQTNELLRTELTKMVQRIEEALINQFGETFRQFNEATQAIKKWQEEHKEHVEQLTEAFKTTATGIEKIRAECEAIPGTMEQLKELVGGINGQLNELDERLKAFANMKEAAEQSFPVIKENLDTIGSNLQNSAEGFSGLEQIILDTYTRAGKLAQEHIENVAKQINQTNEEVNKAIESMAEETRNASNKHIDDIQNTSEQIREKLTEITNQHTQHIENLMEKITVEWGKNMVGLAEKIANVININNNQQ